MARPREFKEDTALDGAIDIFWKQGYGETNLPDLLQAMGLTRGSFYAAFKDKLSAFQAAFLRYENVHLKALLEKISGGSQAQAADRIMPLFDQIDTKGPLEDRRGCFICNVVVELGPQHPDVAQAAARMTREIEVCLQQELQRDAPDNPDSKAQAATLLQLYLGAQAFSKTGAGGLDFREAVRRIIG